MEIDAATAAGLGWPKLKYAWVELERRWLCDQIPLDRVVRVESFTDLYITETQLRLRQALPSDGGAPKLRLGRKADVEAAVRLMTSIYLTQTEYDLLAQLPGRVMRKTRHYLGRVDGAELSVDRFEGGLHGLVLAEAEFDSVEAMNAYPTPDFCKAEVTDDIRYTDGSLVREGLP